MAHTARERAQRAERERVRRYEARRAFHDRRIARRRRDNLVAGIAGGALVLALVGVQFLYYLPELTATPQSSSVPVPTSSTGVTTTPTPTDSATP